MAWNYNEKDYQESKVTIPAGDHRVRIGSVTPKVSRSSGNQMYEIRFDVSNSAFKIYYYLVFTADNVKMVNAKLGQIKDSFGVSPLVDPEVTPSDWIGKTGAARVKLDEEGRPKISFFISKDKQDQLPAWIELGAGGAPKVSGAPAVQAAVPDDLPDSLVIDDDDTKLPFDL